MIPQPSLRLRSTSVAALLVLFLAFGACTNPRNVTALIYMATEVIKLIDTFAKESDLFSEQVSNVTDIMVSNINAKKDVGDLAKFWEKQWMAIHNKYDALSARLETLNGKSAEYFQELDNNNAMISNEALKEQDAAKNLEIKQRWVIEYQKALSSLNATGQMLREGDDFMYLLRNEVLRSKVTESIASLRGIANQAANLSTNIKTFEHRAKLIFQI